MKKSTIALLLAGALILGLVLGGLGIASGATGTANQVHADVPETMMGGTSPVVTLANLTGLSVREIMALRAQGKSLATIATENGVDPATVVDQTFAARKAYLDSLVASGRMTAAKEAKILANMKTAIQTMMNTVPDRSARADKRHATAPTVRPKADRHEETRHAGTHHAAVTKHRATRSATHSSMSHPHAHRSPTPTSASVTAQTDGHPHTTMHGSDGEPHGCD